MMCATIFWHGWLKGIKPFFDDTWFDFPTMRLPFSPEMWLIPLFDHTSGHCVVALCTEACWHFHVGSAGRQGWMWRARRGSSG